MESQTAVLDLAEKDEEYQRLLSEHQEHERQLQELSAKSHLSEEDDLEEKRLKKEKLALKDRMEAIARRYRETGSA
jgi:uncharacterized protein YdcH (DUF465 family)